MIGAWVRQERERRGWSQSELARRAGLTQPAINKLERGKQTSVHEATLAGLGQAFGMDPAAIWPAVYAAANPTLDELRAEGFPSEWLDELTRAEAALTLEDRAAVIKHVRGLLRLTRRGQAGSHDPPGENGQTQADPQGAPPARARQRGKQPAIGQRLGNLPRPGVAREWRRVRV